MVEVHILGAGHMGCRVPDPMNKQALGSYSKVEALLGKEWKTETQNEAIWADMEEDKKFNLPNTPELSLSGNPVSLVLNAL